MAPLVLPALVLVMRVTAIAPLRTASLPRSLSESFRGWKAAEAGPAPVVDKMPRLPTRIAWTGQIAGQRVTISPEKPLGGFQINFTFPF